MSSSDKSILTLKISVTNICRPTGRLQTDRPADGQTDGWTDGRTDRPTDRPTDRQTDRHASLTLLVSKTG